MWGLENCKLNTGKSSVPSIINDLEFISSLLNKPKLFAMNFTSNSRLEDKDYPLLEFHHLKEPKLDDISILAWEFSKLIKSLDFKKATGLDKIPVAVFKNFDPELSPIWAKLFNQAL